MGQRVVALVLADADVELTGAWECASHPLTGSDAGTMVGASEAGVKIGPVWEQDCDVVIDFSMPEAAVALAPFCAERKVPLVMATTGFDAEQKTIVEGVAEGVPLVFAPNMSPAVNVAMKLAEVAAGALRDYPQGVDVEILERHHRFKEDAPSGTALRFGEIIAGVMGQTRHTHGREGRPGARPLEEIGYHAIRVGDNPGEHTIVFAPLGETVEITVRSASRDAYASGAITAAKYAVGRAPGLYSMWDVLGIGS